MTADKSVSFLYTNNELSQRENKNTVLFAIALKISKCLGIKLNKKIKVLYTENYKILMKKLETTQINAKIAHVHGGINIVKMPIMAKSIYRFNIIPFKILIVFFTEIEKKS